MYGGGAISCEMGKGSSYALTSRRNRFLVREPNLQINLQETEFSSSRTGFIYLIARQRQDLPRQHTNS
jgi:hypothetical protein